MKKTEVSINYCDHVSTYNDNWYACVKLDKPNSVGFYTNYIDRDGNEQPTCIDCWFNTLDDLYWAILRYYKNKGIKT